LDLEHSKFQYFRGKGENLEAIAERLDAMRRIYVVTPRMASHFSPVAKLAYEAGLLGANPAGLYRPGGRVARRFSGLFA